MPIHLEGGILEGTAKLSAKEIRADSSNYFFFPIVILQISTGNRLIFRDDHIIVNFEDSHEVS